MGRRRGGLGDLCSRRGLVRRDAPPILFLSAPKRERAAPGVREKTLLVATLHVRAKLLYGGGMRGCLRVYDGIPAGAAECRRDLAVDSRGEVPTKIRV